MFFRTVTSQLNWLQHEIEGRYKSIKLLSSQLTDYTLPTYCQHTDNTLATHWQHTDNILTTHWIICWYPVGVQCIARKIVSRVFPVAYSQLTTHWQYTYNTLNRSKKISLQSVSSVFPEKYLHFYFTGIKRTAIVNELATDW